MAVKFLVPEAFVGKPVNMPGVTKDPYRDLDAISGCNNRDPDLARIGDLTRQYQDRALAVTLVTPGNPGDQDPTTLIAFAVREMGMRVGKQNGFFVMGEDGNQVLMGTADLSSQYKALQAVASFDITAGLDEKRAKTRHGRASHLAVAEELLEAPRNSLVVDAGAGADYDRFRRREEYAQRRGGHLLCHDLVPAAARAANEHTPDIPYLALPDRHEFFAEVLKQGNRPVVITLQDVMSSMAFGEIEGLATNAGLIGAQKIMVEQSLGLSASSNMMPLGCQPEDQRFNELVAQKLTRSVLFSEQVSKLAASPVEAKFLMGLTASQTRHTVLNLMMEIARLRLFQEAAQSAKMPHSRSVVVEQVNDLPPEEALPHLRTHFPLLTDLFQEERFNVLVFGPFGQRVTKESGIPKGSLRVRTQRFSIELGKRSFEAPRITARDGQRVTSCPPNETLTPRSFRKFDALFGAAAIQQVLPGAPSLDHMRSRYPIENFLRAGAEIGTGMVFDFWGRELGHPHVNEFQGSVENRLRKDFTKNL